MVQITNRGRSRTAFPREGECCKGSDQRGAPSPRSALAWTGRCLRVDVPPWRTKKLHFETQFVRFGTYLLATFYEKKSFKVKYWIHCHVWRSSHFSCLDAFVRTFINLWQFKKLVSWGGSSLSETSEGAFPLQKLKNCNFQTQLGAYLLPTFYWKPLFIFNKLLAISCLFLPPFLFWCLC